MRQIVSCQSFKRRRFPVLRVSFSNFVIDFLDLIYVFNFIIYFLTLGQRAITGVDSKYYLFFRINLRKDLVLLCIKGLDIQS